MVHLWWGGRRNKKTLKTACGEATHPLWRHNDPCLIHSTRLRVLTWMVCDLDRRCTFFHFYECCYVGRDIKTRRGCGFSHVPAVRGRNKRRTKKKDNSRLGGRGWDVLLLKERRNETRGFAHRMQHDVEKWKKKKRETCFCRVKPGKDARPHPLQQQRMLPAAGPRQDLSFYGATAPRPPFGCLVAWNMSLSHYCHSDAPLPPFRVRPSSSLSFQVSPSHQAMKPQAGVGHFIVCNIACVPIVALYLMYRLLKEEKTKIRRCDR